MENLVQWAFFMRIWCIWRFLANTVFFNSCELIGHHGNWTTFFQDHSSFVLQLQATSHPTDAWFRFPLWCVLRIYLVLCFISRCRTQRMYHILLNILINFHLLHTINRERNTFCCWNCKPWFRGIPKALLRSGGDCNPSAFSVSFFILNFSCCLIFFYLFRSWKDLVRIKVQLSLIFGFW